MADRETFLRVYLNEIGVHTPVSFSLSGSDIVEVPDRPMPEQADETPKELVSGPSLDELARQAAGCQRCRLAEGRTQVVFGTGNPHADIVFIGEAPGRDEDLQGEPFVGRAGKLLDKMMQAVGLDRQSAYIMNTVKCRPPNNRDPQADELHACRHWFDAQLQLLSPKVICLLGRVAAQAVLESDAPLAALRGRWHDYHGIPVLVTYHPAFLLRSPQQKQRSWGDLLEIHKALQIRQSR